MREYYTAMRMNESITQNKLWVDYINIRLKKRSLIPKKTKTSKLCLIPFT